jgi:hypothetical protein
MMVLYLGCASRAPSARAGLDSADPWGFGTIWTTLVSCVTMERPRVPASQQSLPFRPWSDPIESCMTGIGVRRLDDQARARG